MKTKALLTIYLIGKILCLGVFLARTEGRRLAGKAGSAAGSRFAART